MKKEYKLSILFTLFLFGVISLFFDNQIINFVISYRLELLNKFFIFISNNLILVFLVLVLPAILLWKKNKLAKYHTITFFISLLISIVLKEIFMRPRPEVLQLVTETTYSFPSNHTILVFSILPILFKEKKAWPFLILAILISFSRVYLGVHYMSDVILTALLGLIIGNLILKYSVKNT